MEIRKYIKNGKECLLCLIRKKLIQITPEELVRQEFVFKLVSEFKVPIGLIDVEVPLQSKRERADIIVFGLDKKNNQASPLIVIECKAPNIPLTDNVFSQVVKYDSYLQGDIIILTNGNETISYSWDNDEQNYRKIKSIPKYPDLIKGTDIEFYDDVIDNWERPNHNGNLEKNREFLIDYNNIGVDTKDELVSVITNLVGLIFDEKSKIENLQLNKKKVVIDGGIRYTTFGNAAGGSFTGDYRYFILEDDSNNTEIVSITIMGTLSIKNDSKWGNRTGFTILGVAIDNFEQSHLSLEYSIDRFIKAENDKYSFWHDGTLTVGKLGRVKNKEVIDYVKSTYPHLVKEDKIFLGSINNSNPLNSNDKTVRALIANFIDYGFARDEFRKLKKKEAGQ